MERYIFEGEEYAYWPDVEDLINDTIKRLRVRGNDEVPYVAAAIMWLERELQKPR